MVFSLILLAHSGIHDTCLSDFYFYFYNLSRCAFAKMFTKLEVYYSSIISDYTTNNVYSLQRFNHNRRLLQEHEYICYDVQST